MQNGLPYLRPAAHPVSSLTGPQDQEHDKSLRNTTFRHLREQCRRLTLRMVNAAHSQAPIRGGAGTQHTWSVATDNFAVAQSILYCGSPVSGVHSVAHTKFTRTTAFNVLRPWQPSPPSSSARQARGKGFRAAS